MRLWGLAVNKQLEDKLAHAKREIKALQEKINQQNDLIQRLTKQNGELQYSNREVVRLSDEAFKILGRINGEGSETN